MLSIFRQTQIRKGMRAALIMAVLFMSIAAGSPPAGQAQGGSAPELFGDSGDARPEIAGDNPSFVVRSRYVNVNLGLLLDDRGEAREVSATPEVALNLFPDANYTGVIKRVEKNKFGNSWIGTLKDEQNSYFYLVVADGAFVAHVASTDGIYEVSSAGNNLYQVIQIDQSQLIDDYPGEYEPEGPILTAADLGPNADSANRIDVMVVYTAAALAGEGGLAGLKARIALAMTETNTSYANAGITTRLRLVHIHQMSYTESGNIQTDRDRLAATADGYMDNVHSLRNTYAADMVSLVVENGGGYCGIAKAIMATAASAFQVTARSGCMTGYYSFGHEFGHLQGARHDTYVDPNTTPYAYGHGYVHTHASNAAKRWRTVMAYNNKCSDLGYNCTRLQYWSNPGNTYLGAAMGNSVSKNYLVLNNTDLTVANFRTQKIANNFNSSFNSSSSGWSAVNGTWTLGGSAFYSTPGVANDVSSIKRSGTYGDLTYEARLKRTGCNDCGNFLIIRGNPSSLDPIHLWKPSYVFQYSRDGAFSVLKVNSSGTYTTLKDWTASAAIVTGNNWNTLKVKAVGSSLKFYINGTLVWSGSDSSLKTGQVGIGMYREGASTGNKLYVDWAKLSTTPTADVNADELVAPGTEIPGGDFNQSP